MNLKNKSIVQLKKLLNSNKIKSDDKTIIIQEITRQQEENKKFADGLIKSPLYKKATNKLYELGKLEPIKINNTIVDYSAKLSDILTVMEVYLSAKHK